MGLDTAVAIDPDASLSTLPPQSISNVALPTGHDDDDRTHPPAKWRHALQPRIKTVGVALVLCLHIGVDPPDTFRPTTDDAARLECWLDPLSMPPDKARESIAKTLQQQYEYWQPRARFKHALDPTVEDVKRTLCQLRKGCRGDRLLVHYNGHGVPRPTRNGELWLFNKQFTQYIPVHVKKVWAAVDGPGLLVLDCSSAGSLLNALVKAEEERESVAEALVLAACSAGESLPVATGGSDVPADIFSACLTTPMEVALRVFPRQSARFLPPGAAKRALDLPGRLNDRTSVLGELNWILTAITDTIAWQSLDRPLFQRLFRQDLLVAALFKNFLLACRVMRQHGCTPQSHPPLPTFLIANHPLWHAWAFEVDRCLGTADPHPSCFFAEHRLAFSEIVQSGVRADLVEATGLLPVMMQLLLSQSHRAAALQSFSQYMALGEECVEGVLMVGLLPYIMKLLQSSQTLDIRHPLLWCLLRVLMFDPGCCRQELAKEDCLQSLVHCIFEDDKHYDDGEEAAGAECRVVTIAVVVKCLLENDKMDNHFWASKPDCVAMLVKQVEHGTPLGPWKLLLLGLAVSRAGVPLDVPWKSVLKLLRRTDDPGLRAPRLLRQAAAYCCGCSLKHGADDLVLQAIVLLVDDPSKAVREEAVTALSGYIATQFSTFTRIAYSHFDGGEGGEKRVGGERVDAKHEGGERVDPKHEGGERVDSKHEGGNDQCAAVWKAVLCFAMDPVERISRMAGRIVDEVHMSFLFPAGSMGHTQVTSTSGRRQPPSELVFVSLHPKHRSQSSDNLLPHTDSSRAEEEFKLLHRKLADRSDRPDRSDRHLVELESVLPSASSFPGHMFTLLMHGDPEQAASGERTLKVRSRDRFEVEDAMDRLDEPKRQVAIIDTERSRVRVARFIPASQHGLVCADDGPLITVWQWSGTKAQQAVKTNAFHNGKCGRIRSLAVSGGSSPILAVSSLDSVVRVWRGFECGNESLLSAFSTRNHKGPLVEVLSDNKLLYSDTQDTALCTWDISEERLLSRKPVPDQITCLASNDVVYAGTHGGRLLLVDDRVKELLQLDSQPNRSIRSITYNHPSQQLLISSHADSVVLFDVRKATKQWDMALLHSHVALHPQLPLLASSQKDSLSFYRLHNSTIHCTNSVRYHEGLLGRRVGVINGITPHPCRPLFAVCSEDCTLSIFS